MWPITVLTVNARLLARSRARLVLDHTTLSRQYRQGASRRLLRWTIRLLYPLADARVIVWEGAADDLASLSGMPRSPITVIHNPVDVPPHPLAPPPELLWQGHGKRILTVGSLKPEKEHDLLIRAFAKLTVDASLIVLGDGPCRERLSALVQELGLTDRVTLPSVTIDPWPNYAQADLFVLSSRFDGLPPWCSS